MSILREAHARALRLHQLTENFEPETSGQETPRDRDSYAEPVITGHPADVVDRYTTVTQMGVPTDAGTRGRSSPIVKRAARIEKVVEAFYNTFGSDLLEMEDEDYEDEEDGEDEEDECSMHGRPIGRGRGMCGKDHG